MRFSLRQRLLTVTVLGTIAFAAALLTIVRLARTGREQRIERAHEAVESEIERLRAWDDAPETAPAPVRDRTPRLSGGIRGGYLNPMFPLAWPGRAPGQSVRESLTALRDEADRTGNTAVSDTERPEGTVIVALARMPSGRYAWAASWVPPQRPLQAWRIGLLVLSLATLALVLASVQTLFAFRQGAGTLRASLAALEKNLRAEVTRPTISELGEVADGIAHLAAELAAAQVEHVRLTQELAQRERLASLGRVAAGVAHEVRNPLASMKLRVDLAQRAAGLPVQVAQDLSEVSGEIQRLDRIVSDLLAITGRRLGERVRMELSGLVGQRVALIGPWAAEHGVEITVSGAAVASVDHDAVGRALDNLLRNAVQASMSGSNVSVRLEERDARANVTVIDRGPGVPVEREAELFEPFFTTRAEGTGLGLALSRSIATAHGGTLRYERSSGETRFVLSLPMSGSTEHS